MVSFYKMFVFRHFFLKYDVSHPSCNFHESLREQVVGDRLSLVSCHVVGILETAFEATKMLSRDQNFFNRRLKSTVRDVNGKKALVKI